MASSQEEALAQPTYSCCMKQKRKLHGGSYPCPLNVDRLISWNLTNLIKVLSGRRQRPGEKGRDGTSLTPQNVGHGPALSLTWQLIRNAQFGFHPILMKSENFILIRSPEDSCAHQSLRSTEFLNHKSMPKLSVIWIFAHFLKQCSAYGQQLMTGCLRNSLWHLFNSI